jgi:hypothetical protein
MSCTYEKVKQQFDALFENPLPPSGQVDPTRSAQIIAQEYLNVPAKKQVVKGVVPKPPKSLREQNNLSRRDIVTILDKIETRRTVKKDSPLLTARDAKDYRALASNNITIEALASSQDLSVTALKVLLEETEKTILGEVQYLRQHGVNLIEGMIRQPDAVEPKDEGADQNDAIVAEAQENDQRDARFSSGGSIGGRIISRGKSSTGKPLALDSFERSGKMREEKQTPDEESNTSRHVEHDDYSEESSA